MACRQCENPQRHEKHTCERAKGWRPLQCAPTTGAAPDTRANRGRAQRANQNDQSQQAVRRGNVWSQTAATPGAAVSTRTQPKEQTGSYSPGPREHVVDLASIDLRTYDPLADDEAHAQRLGQKRLRRRLDWDQKRRRVALGRKRNHDRCAQCRKPGFLLCCDGEGCFRSYHLFCVGRTACPPAEAEWLCPHCGGPDSLVRAARGRRGLTLTDNDIKNDVSFKLEVEKVLRQCEAWTARSLQVLRNSFPENRRWILPHWTTFRVGSLAKRGAVTVLPGGRQGKAGGKYVLQASCSQAPQASFAGSLEAEPAAPTALTDTNIESGGFAASGGATVAAGSGARIPKTVGRRKAADSGPSSPAESEGDSFCEQDGPLQSSSSGGEETGVPAANLTQEGGGRAVPRENRAARSSTSVNIRTLQPLGGEATLDRSKAETYDNFEESGASVLPKEHVAAAAKIAQPATSSGSSNVAMKKPAQQPGSETYLIPHDAEVQIGGLTTASTTAADGSKGKALIPEARILKLKPALKPSIKNYYKLLANSFCQQSGKTLLGILLEGQAAKPENGLPYEKATVLFANGADPKLGWTSVDWNLPKTMLVGRVVEPLPATTRPLLFVQRHMYEAVRDHKGRAEAARAERKRQMVQLLSMQQHAAASRGLFIAADNDTAQGLTATSSTPLAPAVSSLVSNPAQAAPTSSGVAGAVVEVATNRDAPPRKLDMRSARHQARREQKERKVGRATGAGRSQPEMDLSRSALDQLPRWADARVHRPVRKKSSKDAAEQSASRSRKSSDGAGGLDLERQEEMAGLDASAAVVLLAGKKHPHSVDAVAGQGGTHATDAARHASSSSRDIGSNICEAPPPGPASSGAGLFDSSSSQLLATDGIAIGDSGASSSSRQLFAPPVRQDGIAPLGIAGSSGSCSSSSVINGARRVRIENVALRSDIGVGGTLDGIQPLPQQQTTDLFFQTHNGLPGHGLFAALDNVPPAHESLASPHESLVSPDESLPSPSEPELDPDPIVVGGYVVTDLDTKRLVKMWARWLQLFFEADRAGVAPYLTKDRFPYVPAVVRKEAAWVRRRWLLLLRDVTEQRRAAAEEKLASQQRDRGSTTKHARIEGDAGDSVVIGSEVHEKKDTILRPLADRYLHARPFLNAVLQSMPDDILHRVTIFF